MRILRTIAITGVALALAASLVPAQATCGSPQLYTTISTNTSFVWVDGWDVVYYAPGYPPASFTQPPTTPEFFAVYWALGTGNTILGVGDDAGTYTVPPQGWVYYDLLGGAYPTGAKVFGNWAQQGIDGCIPANGTCECLLMTDEKDGIGYFAIASKATDANGNAYFVQPGTTAAGFAPPIILRAVPAPDVTRVDLNEDTMVETWNVTVGDVVDGEDGVYELDGCDCGPGTYQLYWQAVPENTAAPVSRNAAEWTAIGAPVPMGSPTAFDFDCSTLAENSDVYLAAGLVFANGFPGGPYKVTLSGNSLGVRCGPTIADPVDLQPRNRIQRRDVPRPERKR